MLRAHIQPNRHLDGKIAKFAVPDDILFIPEIPHVRLLTIDECLIAEISILEIDVTLKSTTLFLIVID